MKLEWNLSIATALIGVICCYSVYADLLFESCSNSEYALVGDLLQWSSTATCNISSGTGQAESIVYDGKRVYLSQPGLYQYGCQNDSVNLTVVSTQYRVGLCSSCGHQDLVVRRGQLIHWAALDDFNCTEIRLVVGGCQGDTIETFIKRRGIQHVYKFDEIGVYQLLCGDDCRQLAAIAVLKGEEDEGRRYREIIYTHAVVMFLSFGLVLPLGALLAHLKKPVVHLIMQPLGLVLAVTGFLMAVVYKEINSTTHFDEIHTIFGLLLLIGALLVLPGLKLSVMSPMREKAQRLVNIWHRRLGLVAVFSGIFNIFLGLSVLPNTPSYVTALYGVWTFVLIVVFVIAKRGHSHREEEDDEESVLSLCCHYKADQMQLTRQDSLPPSKLSQDPFTGRGKFVQIRKKSVDVLEMRTQRKISNVHFGPVAIAALTPAPYTPQDDNATEFKFNNQLPSNHYEDEKPYNSCSENSNSDGSSDESSVDGAVLVEKARGKSDSQFSLNSFASNGGSVRITRHSDRARRKVDELFPPSNSLSSSRRVTPSPLIFSQDKEDNEETEEEKQKKEVSPEDFPKGCPFHQSDSTPLQQRRMRKNAFTPVCDEDDLLQLQEQQPEVRKPLQRGLSRNASFRRKQEMVDHTLRSVMEMSDNAIICANNVGDIVFWSAGAMKMFGYTPGEAIGSSLKIVMPQRFRDRHQNGINGRAERAHEYVKKHQSAPEEHKHARLYSVAGISKTGKEFDVEVIVTSFVIEGSIFFTGIISELKGLTRHLSASSISSEVEIREKQQKALAIGVQMKIAHKLRSADHMRRNELTKILKTSLQGTQFEVPPEDIVVMVDGIMKAADADETGVIKFVDLIDLLVKHRLYISDSGFIAKYGKSKTSARNITAPKKCGSSLANFISSRAVAISWGLVYLIASILLMLIGVISTPNNGWGQWAYGTGPVLSFNCVLVIIPMMRSLIHNMRGSTFLNKILPLKNGLFFHILIVGAIFGWTLVHILTHLCSFTLDNIEPNSTQLDNFTANLMTHLSPIITGVLIVVILLVMTISSIKAVSSLCLFVGFHVIHWVGFIVMYLLLIVHGINWYNPSFWKWLLPVALVYILERIYFRWVIPRYSIKIIKSAPYDELSRTTKVEFEKPPHYKLIAGQYILVNMPQIGYFNWQPCYISSINKEKTLTVYFPHNGCRWFEKAYTIFKQHPIKPKVDGETSSHSISITRPFGAGVDHIFDYKAAVLLCGGGEGLPTCRSVIQKFLQYRRKGSSCQCGLHPILTKLYFVWVTPSGNDNEWFTDFLIELTEDEHLRKYLDIRIFLTNIDSPPDELASALLHLALKTGGPALSVRRPSQPQLSKLYTNTSYGLPDFESLLDFVSIQQGTSNTEVECGVFTVGSLPLEVRKDLLHYSKVCSKKKGPMNRSLSIDSPYRSNANKISTPPPEGPAPEWHITFEHQPLIL